MTGDEIWGALAAALVLLGGIWVMLVISCGIGVVCVLAASWICDALRQPRHRASPDDLLADLPAAPVPADGVILLHDRWVKGQDDDEDTEDEWWVPVPSQRTGYTAGGDDALSTQELEALAATVLDSLGRSVPAEDESRRRGAHGSPAQAAALAAADQAAWEWIDRTLPPDPWYAEVVDLCDVQEDVRQELGNGGGGGACEGDGH